MTTTYRNCQKEAANSSSSPSTQKREQRHHGHGDHHGTSKSSYSSYSVEEKNKIVEKASFITQQGVKILHICGTPYEMGYQHGFLLADRIQTMVTQTVFALPSFIQVATDTFKSLDSCIDLAKKGQQAALPFLPGEILEEICGIADGAKDAGVGESVTLSDILLFHTYYDQWCMYCHPYYWQPKHNGNLTKQKQQQSCCCSSPKKNGMVQGSGGCSSFCAWDEWAGGEHDGKLIMGKNEDNFNMPYQLENRIMVVAKPKSGFGHWFMTYPGLVGLDGGFNEAGFAMMTQLNSMIHETMEGCGIAVFTRLLLTHVSSVEQAVEQIQNHKRCGGIAYHVMDSKAKKAAIVETSSKMVCVRYPIEGVKALWQTNHSNCYPGWEGYSGYNMVQDQKPVNELQDISTIEKWQASLRDPNNKYVQAPSRYERYRELIYKFKGNITVEHAQAILSDCFDPYSGKERPKQVPSTSNNVMCTICALYPDVTFSAPDPLGTFEARIGNMWSVVSIPETGDFWLAVQGFPAQYGGYERFNLHELLGGTR